MDKYLVTREDLETFMGDESYVEFSSWLSKKLGGNGFWLIAEKVE